jgi:hypothetical protein
MYNALCLLVTRRRGLFGDLCKPPTQEPSCYSLAVGVEVAPNVIRGLLELCQVHTPDLCSHMVYCVGCS